MNTVFLKNEKSVLITAILIVSVCHGDGSVENRPLSFSQSRTGRTERFMI